MKYIFYIILLSLWLLSFVKFIELTNINSKDSMQWLILVAIFLVGLINQTQKINK